MTTSHTAGVDARVPAKLTIPAIQGMKERGERIAMVTAYDAAGARLAEAAGIDMLLVGDSAAMVVLGHDSTVPVTMDEMLMMTRAVTRSVQRPIVVGDLPFGAFQVSDTDATANAIRFVKEAGADVVKLEGAGPMLSRAEAIVAAGIPVMGHIGLTPQSSTALGGFKAQGRTAAAAHKLLEDALALQAAGCFAIVLEAVPEAVATHISATLTIPTIGIGAGAGCDGQVLVYHDLLGLTQGQTARFVKRYADLDTIIGEALTAYVSDVRSGAYPEERHTYRMAESELAEFEASLEPSLEAARGIPPRD
ncbi:MAG: 3-methyl-2-oxobutanoate hydroxymethyltransferase [Chloroflexota bacterium]